MATLRRLALSSEWAWLSRWQRLRYRWYYPKCFHFQLPDEHSLFIWVFSPLWPKVWLGRKVWQRDPDALCSILTLGPLEFTLSYPHWSRLARRRGG